MFSIGTISHGTLRSQDLLRSFAEAFKQFIHKDDFDNPQQYAGSGRNLYDEAIKWADFIDETDEISETDYVQIDATLDDLIDRLEGIASEYGCYFGATEGDGSDFGFWPNEGGEA